MKILVKCILYFLVFGPLMGCHIYSGHSWDTKLKYPESEDLKRNEVTMEKFQEIYVAIQNSANNFGFMPYSELSYETPKLLLKKNKPQNALQELYGSDSRSSISVYIIQGTTIDHYIIRIFFRDYTYNQETEFSKSVNEMLEDLLTAKFGFTGVEFVRAKVFILND